MTPEKSRDPRTELKVLSQAEKILSSIRPFLRNEGSDVVTKDFRDGVLYLTVSGACVGCALAGNDLGDLTSLLKENIPEVRQVTYLNINGLPIF